MLLLLSSSVPAAAAAAGGGCLKLWNNLPNIIVGLCLLLGLKMNPNQTLFVISSANPLHVGKKYMYLNNTDIVSANCSMSCNPEQLNIESDCGVRWDPGVKVRCDIDHLSSISFQETYSPGNPLLP